jgi:hypothetical protein
MLRRAIGSRGACGRAQVFDGRRGLAACGVAALAFAALTAVALASDGSAVECVGYQDLLHPPGVTHLMVSNAGPDSLGFEVRYLDLDRTVLRSEQFTLEGGASRDVETATPTAGYAAQVLSASDLSVSSHVTSVAAAGEDQSRTIACTGPGAVL